MAAGKAISREDLIYILQGVFKVSAKAENGFELLDDGFYTKDYKSHVENEGIHVSAETRAILEKLSVNSEGIIMYDGQFAARISDDDGNGLEMRPDGLFIKDQTEVNQKIQNVKTDLQDTNNTMVLHNTNGDIHVTPEDKIRWDNARAEARDEAKKEMEKITQFSFKTVKVLPELTDASSTVVYMLYDPNYIEGLTYTLWIKDIDKWQQLNMSMSVFKDLLKKTELDEVMTKFMDDHYHEHRNLNELNKISEDADGNLLYNNKMVTGVDPLEIRDLINSIKNASTLGVQKKVLFRGKMDEAGKYQLAADIENFSFLIIDYRTDYRREGDPDGSSKSATVDPDTLAELYDEGLDYLLELGHGTSCAEARINARGDMFWVNYWNRITIYKITGYGEKEVAEDGGESA